MSRGIGALQREIKRVLDVVFKHEKRTMRFADIRSTFVMLRGGDPEQDVLTPTFERSLKRALKGLIDRGDVLIAAGQGGPGDPRCYVTVEKFAGAVNGKKKVKDTAHAKQIVTELGDAMMKMRMRR